ncbi:hypothetical protein VNO78_33046 [Psophocarpus tetragonolobus]|uniref:Leucine-rich repeat-containing N-terminal plant-type domain-containing protein n=1 Tax=Psophocarpus tetragonolobus TaxID=3891 RepID=A0AAN9P1F8_PSOTE
MTKITMRSYFLKIFNVLSLLLLHTSGSTIAEVKCKEKERQSLLKFKQGLLDDSRMLSTWSEDENNGDCCKWKRVKCNNATGHVQVLDLHGEDEKYLMGAVNITSLIELQNLEYLDLSWNDFIYVHIPKHIGCFTNLRYLNLSYSEVSGSIPFELGNLSKLEYLNLNNNHLFGEIPSQLGKLARLQYLDLRHNNDIHGEIPYQLGNLSQLRYLDLAGNFLSGAIPFQTGNLTMLHTFRLGGNFDVETNGAEWLSNLHYLTNLELRSLYNLVSSHYLLQTISNIIPNLKELRLVDCYLVDNDIQILFDPHSNFSTYLTVLDLSHNMLTSSAFRLFLVDENFLVSSASKTNFSSSLVFLDISFNLLKSPTIFHWLFNFTTNLHNLILHGNMLEGPVPDELGKVMNSLEALDLSSNKLHGEVPSFFGNICTLQELYLDRNNFSGEISSFIQNGSWCNRHVFHSLGLSYNQITGLLPKNIGLLSELKALYLQGNSLEGEITESHLSNFSKLEYLHLSYNSLSIKFDFSWVPPFLLGELGLASCKLGSSFPSWLQTQTFLSVLDISDAGLKDTVPEWLWNNMKFMHSMNMSYNSLVGSIPNKPFKLPYAPSLYLQSNQFEGGVPTFLQQASKDPEVRLKCIDISSNNLTGGIPKEIGYLLGLVSLNLSRNNLNGEIPSEIGNLNSLEFVDLSRNHFSGKIPSSLSKIDRLAVLDLSDNSLFGRIPYGRQLQTFDVSSFKGNPDLCGPLLNKSCPEDQMSKHPKESTRNETDDNPVFFSKALSAYMLVIWDGSVVESEICVLLKISRLDRSFVIPDGRQFQTFDASSFEGNPDLCGKPLNRSCPEDMAPTQPQESTKHETDDNSVFYKALYMSMSLGFFTGIRGLIGSIILWRPWRYAYLRFLDRLTNHTYVIVVMNVRRCHSWLRGY